MLIVSFTVGGFTASENLLTDGGFETGAVALSSWALNVSGDTAAATRMIDSTSGTAHGGKAFQRITVTAVSSQNWHVQLKDPTWEAKTGNIYHFSMWARSDSARTSQISVYGGADSKDTYRTSSTASLTTEWKQYHQMFKADTDGKGQINFAFVCGFSVGTYDIDDVVITEAVDTLGTLYLNGDFEAEGATWGLYVNPDDPNAAATMTFPSEGAKSGSKFCRVTVTGAPESQGDVQLDDGSWTSDSGAAYTFTFWGKADAVDKKVDIAVQAGSSHDYAYLGGTTVTLTTEWTEHSYTYTVDSIYGDDEVSFKIYCGAATGIYDFDAITLSKEIIPDGTVIPLHQHAAQMPSIRIYPQYLHCTGAAIRKITICDLRGRVFHALRMNPSSATQQFRLPRPSRGTWIITVATEATSSSRRIMIP